MVIPEVRSYFNLDNEPIPRLEPSLGCLFYPSYTFISDSNISFSEEVNSTIRINDSSWSVFPQEKIDRIKRGDQIEISSIPQLILASPKDIIITSINLQVDNYSAPPTDFSNFSALIIDGCPMGSGPLPGIDFEPISVKPDNGSYRLTTVEDTYFNDSYLPYKVDAGDAVMINPYILFGAFGHYQIRFTIEAIDINSENSALSIQSPTIVYKSVSISSDELRKLPTTEYTLSP